MVKKILSIFGILFIGISASAQKLQLSKLINAINSVRPYHFDTVYYVSSVTGTFLDAQTPAQGSKINIKTFRTHKELVQNLPKGKPNYLLSFALIEVGVGILTVSLSIGTVDKDSFDRDIPILGFYSSDTIECIFNKDTNDWIFNKILKSESM